MDFWKATAIISLACSRSTVGAAFEIMEENFPIEIVLMFFPVLLVIATSSSENIIDPYSHCCYLNWIYSYSIKDYSDL